jgi:ribosomal protein S18 acetylase RimI-like enzyme
MTLATHVIRECPAARRPDALRKLAAPMTYAGKAALAAALRRQLDEADAVWDGLLIAEDAAGDIEGVVWVQPQPGSVAVVWPPDTRRASAHDLLRFAAEHAAAQRLRVAQILVAPQDQIATAVLTRAGFPLLAELRYLWAEAHPKLWEPDVADLTFETVGSDRQAALARVIENTYIGTQDCPSLDRARPMSEVLAGYRAQGAYLPDQWLLVRTGGDYVGVLLMAGHPETNNWELMYMGVTPEARGRGYGVAIATHAVRVAAQGGARRVVLAVDAGNGPARAVYRRAGFVQWDRRSIYAHVLHDGPDSTQRRS